jgi:signal transduction histidine kinase
MRKEEIKMRLFLSRMFTVIMMAAAIYGAYQGIAFVVKYANDNFQKYYAYPQTESDVEYVMVNAAEAVMQGTIEMAAGGSGSSGMVELPDESYEDEILWNIHGIVDTKDYYFEKESGDNEIERLRGSFGADDDFAGSQFMAFFYDGTTAYIKYPDNSIEEYKNANRLVSLDIQIRKMKTVLSYENVTVCIWMDESYYNERNGITSALKELQACKLEYLLVVLAVAVVAFLFAVALSVRSAKEQKKTAKMLTEIPLVLIVLIGIGLLVSVDMFVSRMYYRSYYNQTLRIVLTVIYAVAVFVFYKCVREIVLKIREKGFFRDSAVIRLLCTIAGKCRLMLDKSGYNDFSLTKKLWIRRILFLVFSILYVMAAVGLTWVFEDAAVILAVLYLLILGIYNYYEMRFFRGLNEVYNQIDDMYHGEYTVRDVEESDLTYDMVDKLNDLSNGLEEAIEKRISSEKMKVELITNVSHDLKTPLTSIISYVDLLKQESMSEVAAAYVKILEDKSYQLKNIVADVFDLAKASSGQDVEIETIDGIMLVNQVMADMEDSIVRSGRMIKADIQPDTFFIRGDGKKLYRALQNLLDNALKYSMEGTRIYIRSQVVEDKLQLEIKNIAAYEMDFTGEEIVERFVRGDESRTTEGNGLGLSIAKSFIEVSGGNMQVVVDGDVFKVFITF